MAAKQLAVLGSSRIELLSWPAHGLQTFNAGSVQGVDEGALSYIDGLE